MTLEKRDGLTDDTEFAEELLDDRVVRDGDALAVGLGVSALVDEFADRLEVGLAVGDVGSDEVEHLLRRLGDADEHAVVDLQQAKELEDLLRLGSDLRDTAVKVSQDHLTLPHRRSCSPLETDDKVDFGLCRDVKVSSLPRLALESDLLLLLSAVLLHIFVGALEDDLALGLLVLWDTRISDHPLSILGMCGKEESEFSPERWLITGSMAFASRDPTGVGGFASLIKW